METLWHMFITSLRRQLDILDTGLSDVMLSEIPDQQRNADSLSTSRRMRLTILANTSNTTIGVLATCTLDLLGHPIDLLSRRLSKPEGPAPFSARDKMRRHLSKPVFAEMRTMGASVCYLCGKYESRQQAGVEYSSCSKCGIATFCSRECQVQG